jgi:hypothetical protein
VNAAACAVLRRSLAADSLDVIDAALTVHLAVQDNALPLDAAAHHARTALARLTALHDRLTERDTR